MARTILLLIVAALLVGLLMVGPAHAIKVYSNPSIQNNNVSPDGVYTEGNMMQDVSNRFMSKLSARGFETRGSGWLGLADACNDAVNWHANIFISNHTNAMGGGWQTGARGTEGFYTKSSGGYYDPVDVVLCDDVTHKVISKFAPWGRNYDRGTFADIDRMGWNMYVLCNTPGMNSVLIEGLFHDNSADVAVLNQASGRDAYAQGLFEGTCDFFGWSYAGWDSAFSAQSYTASMSPGQQATAWLEYKNTGGTTWTNSGNNPVRLGTQNPQDHASVFYTAGDWVNSSRPTNMDQASVGPNGIGRFTFIMTAPNSPGSYQEYYKLVSEGQCWFGYGGAYFTVVVSQADVIIDNVDSRFYASANWATSTYPGYYGTNYRTHPTQNISDGATWTPNLPVGGNYEVYAWWVQGTNRATNAPYVIYWNGGQTTVNVNQQINGSVWNSLGTYNFAAGTGGKALLSCWTNTTGQYVIADAVKFVKR